MLSYTYKVFLKSPISQVGLFVTFVNNIHSEQFGNNGVKAIILLELDNNRFKQFTTQL